MIMLHQKNMFLCLMHSKYACHDNSLLKIHYWSDFFQAYADMTPEHGHYAKSWHQP